MQVVRACYNIVQFHLREKRRNLNNMSTGETCEQVKMIHLKSQLIRMAGGREAIFLTAAMLS
jgi:hypothetical protein